MPTSWNWHRNHETETIKNKKRIRSLPECVDEMFDKKVNSDSNLGDQVKIMLLLIKQYEDINYPIPSNSAMGFHSQAPAS